ncbi:NAD(P)/FAD-dependent oxidoreductase [Spongiimicrobium sp. 3-5]|uniref:NAD(P)/FAD-dependent oxidoreductase n=1 Tax=Spongiimicrobium sp. 3-5 TaxID=3332596 RepID=UPI00397F69C6
MFDVIIVGGGAAGFYAAIHIAETAPQLKVAIVERGKEVLAKVRVSGGGRCNVTHAEFDPNELVKNYPRGEKELLGPFYTHGSRDTVAFFEGKGISLKTEEDGRMFPKSNTSQTIIDFFMSEIDRLGVTLLRHSAVTNITSVEVDAKTTQVWQVKTIKKTYSARKILIASGSSSKIWNLMEALGHTIQSPVPSLFTFNIKDPRIQGIPGVSTYARVSVLPKKIFDSKITVKLKSKIEQTPKLESEGPLLITHWGISGPAVLKLSAWGARALNERNYKFKVKVNWLPDYYDEAVQQLLLEIKEVEAKKTVLRTHGVDIPRRLWINLVRAAGIADDMKWADTSKDHLASLSEQLTASIFVVDGKSTFKEEFVTAGGIELKEINFKTYESKLRSNLYFAGEVINVDAITGGFNFQNAWTGAYIAAQAITKE